LRYTFTLAGSSNLVDGIASVPPQRGFFGPAADSFIARLVDYICTRRASIHPRGEDKADIVNPYQRAPEVFEQMADQSNAVIRQSSPP